MTSTASKPTKTTRQRKRKAAKTTVQPVCPYPTKEAFIAMLKAGDAAAADYVIASLKHTRGSVRGAALNMGVSLRSMHYWRQLPVLKERFDKEAMGRAGAGPAATRARIAAQR